MVTAVYILSPEDNVDDFSSHSLSREHDGRKVFVGEITNDVRSVVFADGSPTALKAKLDHDEVWNNEWKIFKTRVTDMLKSVHIESENLHIFIHFGGQGNDEIDKFNKKLGEISSNDENARCYAISFGYKYPDALFINGKFSPPNGEAFLNMCHNLQKGKIDDFENLRALRVLLSNYSIKDDKTLSFDNFDHALISIFGSKIKFFEITAGERNLISGNDRLMALFHINNINDRLRTPEILSYDEYEYLISNLFKKEE